ncbi:MAG: hypothetical protein OEW15_04990 [Nitrospirota bacterium]|nr:hypothetical protein [Nitrospirota bacterium]
MFTINESLKDLKVKERNIFKILYSMNSHPVAMPGYASEEARCYILFFSEGPNLSAFIGLYLTHVDQKFFYTYTSNPFPFEAQQDVEDEARNFAEEMGFLLDEINVSGMAVDDRNHWIEEQLIFGYKSTAPEEKPVAAAAPRTAAASEPQAPSVIEQVEVPASPAPAPQPVPQQGQIQQTPPITPYTPAPQQPPAYQPMPPQTAQPINQHPPQQYPAGYPPAPTHAQPQQPPAAEAYPPKQSVAHTYQPEQGYTPPVPHSPAEHYAPPVLEEPPVLEHPEDQVAEKKPEPRATMPSPPKVPAKKKPAATKAVSPPVREEETEDEVAVEFEVEQHDRKPRSLFEEAIKQGVVKPPKPKTVRVAQPASGVVTRDKEALARLLASF